MSELSFNKRLILAVGSWILSVVFAIFAPSPFNILVPGYFGAEGLAILLRPQFLIITLSGIVGASIAYVLFGGVLS